MNVDQIDQVIKGLTGQKETKDYLRTISHWLKRIKDSKNGYIIYDESEKANVMKLVELKLVSLKEDKDAKVTTFIATLTESGQELYKDFFRTGYFLKA